MHFWRLNNVYGNMFAYLGCEPFMQIGVGMSSGTRLLDLTCCT